MARIDLFIAGSVTSYSSDKNPIDQSSHDPVDLTNARYWNYFATYLGDVACESAGRRIGSVLRRGFRLAIDKGLLAAAPVFRLPRVANARSGFFEDGDFTALLLELPSGVRDLVQFLRATGWWRDEGRLLRWSSVDMKGGTIRLEEARSKSGEPPRLPVRPRSCAQGAAQEALGRAERLVCVSQERPSRRDRCHARGMEARDQARRTRGHAGA